MKDAPQSDLAVQPTSPADLLAIGLGPSDDGVDVDAELDLGAFLCAMPDLELHGCLGRGGMGLVFRARQVRLDRYVAVKLMNPELAKSEEFAQRFEREARALARLDHPGIVRVHDFGEAGGVYYLVMEYVEGVNLRELLEEGVESAQAEEIIAQLCDALAYAHEHGVVHRDIKPENVLLDRGGRVKVADFGLAKLQVDRGSTYGTRTRRVIGTPQYMAPEQLGSPETVDHRADIFAIGVVFYEMLTGQLPVGRFPTPSELGRADARLDEIVLRALESNRERRFQAASELRAALISQPLDDPSQATVLQPPRLPSARSPMMFALGLGTLAATAGVLFMLWPPAAQPPAVGEAAVAGSSDGGAEHAPVAARREPSPLRWPMPELASLPADTAAVVGIDGAELRQAPVIAPYWPNVFDAPEGPAKDCVDKVITRTFKLIAAADAEGELREIRLLADWQPEDLQTCLEMTRLGGDGPQPNPIENVETEEQDGAMRYRWTRADKREGFVVGRRGSTIIVRLGADATFDELRGRFIEEPTSAALRDRIADHVDLSAPVWAFADTHTLEVPLGIVGVYGQIELWDALGLDVTLQFPDEAAAASAFKLVESYANVAASMPIFPETPVFSVEHTEDRIRVSGTIDVVAVAAAAAKGDGDGEHEFGFSVNMPRHDLVGDAAAPKGDHEPTAPP